MCRVEREGEGGRGGGGGGRERDRDRDREREGGREEIKHFFWGVCIWVKVDDRKLYLLSIKFLSNLSLTHTRLHLQRQEEDFRLQSKTLMEELGKVGACTFRL